MSLQISTFDNKSNTGDPLFKALGHPAMAARVRDWIANIACMGRIAVVDPWGQFSSLAALYDIGALNIEGRYVQRIEDLTPEHHLPGSAAPKSLLDLPTCNADVVMLAAFDGDHAQRAVSPLLPEGVKIISFDELKLEDRFITNKRRYLDPLNFATNFALFRAGEGRHSVVRTANYWSGYGAVEPRLMMILFNADGEQIAEWEEVLQPGQSIVIDAEETRVRFSLPAFNGMLLIHAVGIAGHADVKYVMDDVDDARRDPALTHDSNSWPAQYYCGLPAPRRDESVRLWLQNSHPCPIPPGAISIGVMGHNETVVLDKTIPGFGTYCLKVEEILSDKHWPLQFELSSGNHVVRPRYEIVTKTKMNGPTVTFAHMNVERIDLHPDPVLTQAARMLGKGYLLPAPILALKSWRNFGLVTPAARTQTGLPVAIKVYSSDGELVFEKSLGFQSRATIPEINFNTHLLNAGIADDFEGHLELMFDYDQGVDIDGWLHALFRYENIETGQMGDTSFGAHVFNMPITFRNEPQSYSGKAPGLSTRLFARMTPAPLEPFVHLTYTSSGKWHDHSTTSIVLNDDSGRQVAQYDIAIPLYGSRLLMAGKMFDAAALAEAGPNGYMMIIDKTCRLFGYHGVTGPNGQFALDHMFGF